MKRSAFILPVHQHYLCGHSLGPMPHASQQFVMEAMTAWQQAGVQAWNDSDWIHLPQILAGRLAPLLGARPEEVVLSDSTSMNLYKVLHAALALQPKRRVILTTSDNFPADLYIIQGLQAAGLATLKVVPMADLAMHLDEQVAVLLLNHVNYRDASVSDMAQWVAAAHQVGALMVSDVSHSVGLMPLQLSAAEVDFAVGCTYKYLSGGPGAPAFIYANQKHLAHLHQPIYGWMGHAAPFAFEATYRSEGIASFLGGTPYVLSLKALEGALSVFASVDLQALYALSVKRSAALIDALTELDVQCITPRTGQRGGHVAWTHDAGYAISRALIAHGVQCDYRAPGVIRFCVNPLYLEIADLTQSIQQLSMILERRIYQEAIYQEPLKVT